jgi:hypothetical protein
MLPRFDVDVSVGEINPELLRVIWIDEVIDGGIGDNRQYVDLTDAEWSDVEPMIAAEEALIKAAASSAADQADFERIIGDLMDEQYPGDDFDEGPLSQFAMLDAGVIAAVAALSAARCVSTTSCRGHNGHGEPNPLVRFAADEHRLPLIRDACTRSGCGLLMDYAGMLQLYATDVLALMEFANQMILLRDDFEAIDAEVACRRPDDEYFCDYDTGLRRRDLYSLSEERRMDQIVQCAGQLSMFDDETESSSG